ncbi:amino acid permease [Saccharicrinis sp. FJH54]|uniref:amino acid permease n=1 Tax=Saccharicrinis sp. FJH54 TaxID=3344665 RepID=UPI0035D3F1F6
MPKENNKRQGFGTAPVFFTAISTILGAILFLRFGWAVGTMGFWGVIGIIILGHLVTIPTALALSEIATNKRVEGGGEYFIISRSFGLNIGATIGIALYLSQAISVAFYVIAFTEAFSPLFNMVQEKWGWDLPRQVVSVPAMLLLSLVILKKGANLGVKTLYVVVAILFVSLLLFFLGTTEFQQNHSYNLFEGTLRNTDQFFMVFAIIFPAFTGMTAGVGLSGELRNPSKSIPLGTVAATLTGMVFYVFVVYKLAISASAEDMMSDQLIMSRIAIGGAIAVPIGLAASTISSAIGSVMVAPRTLQALSRDYSFPSRRMNVFLARGKGTEGEPFNATLVTCIIAMIFVALGDVNTVASIISMFFMVTYGSLSLISFLNHFGASPSYRPSFRSRWGLSLIGFVISVWVMFMIDPLYAILATLIIILFYIGINYYHRDRKGLEAIFSNALFQLNRNLQVYLQKNSRKKKKTEWRPSAICISDDSFNRDSAFDLLNWISYRFGFGTYIHLIHGYYSRKTHEQAEKELDQLILRFKSESNQVYIDTMISPSYTTAVAQAIQVPGISGMENNMVILEFEKNNPDNLDAIVENFGLVRSGNFDVCVLGSSARTMDPKKGIHVWIRATDEENSNLMIMLSYIIMAHPDWHKSNIRLFEICKKGEEEKSKTEFEQLVQNGRLQITTKNIEIITQPEQESIKKIINERSKEAALTMVGFHDDMLKHIGKEVFQGYDDLGTVLFINSHKQIDIV